MPGDLDFEWPFQVPHILGGTDGQVSLSSFSTMPGREVPLDEIWGRFHFLHFLLSPFFHCEFLCILLTFEQYYLLYIFIRQLDHKFMFFGEREGSVRQKGKLYGNLLFIFCFLYIK